MGDLIGQEVAGKLLYYPYRELKRISESGRGQFEHTALFADMCRLNALYMISRAGSGHIGSSFSSLDIISYLLLCELDVGLNATDGKDIFFSSKGHDAPAYYAALMGTGAIKFENIHKLRKIDGLPGHPDVQTKGIVTNTGSLGMGVSKAKGMIYANRLKGRLGRVVVMTGDGELQEGQFWESLVSAVNNKLSELIILIDHNKLQSDTFVKNVSDLGDLEQKLSAYGLCVARCDGNDVVALSETFKAIRDDVRPKVIIADTVKGKGVSFMEHTSLDSDVDMYAFHSGAPDKDAYQLAAKELILRVQNRAEQLHLGTIELETEAVEPGQGASSEVKKLIPAYSEALIALASKRDDVVALDADLVLDTGLIPFREKYPKRFFECGIAEQDMVSTAGGMALGGLLPIVHSFACFLSSRPNEQIYNNATERTKVIYIGSLAGVLPGGPGHSHQAVRDVAALSAIPDFAIVEPSCPSEVGNLLEWCANVHTGSSYMRLTSIPWEIPFDLPSGRSVSFGQGNVLLEGADIALISHGPIMLSQAYNAVKKFAQDRAIEVKLIDMPWLNHVDDNWLEQALAGCSAVLCVENHYSRGSLSDTLAKVLVQSKKLNVTFSTLGLTDVPPSGTNAQVLESVGLNEPSILDQLISIADSVQRYSVKRNEITAVTEGYSLWTQNSLEEYRCKSFRTKEAETVAWIEQVMQDGDVLYDVGANIGLYAIFAGLIHPNSTVYAFEPLARNFNRLCENIQLNNSGNVVPLHIALSNVSRIDQMHVSDERVGGSGSQLGAPVSDEGEPFVPVAVEHVPTFSMDALIESLSIVAPDHIKIDVDGLEAKIVEGMDETLSSGSVKSVLIELNKNITDQARIFDYMKGKGYSANHVLNSHPNHSRHRRSAEKHSNVENVIFTKD
ncbi:FkbM family methyltransferase [Thalassospira povalilytica]|uniref:FkbM family methyltransferase n=1 Tax=Thalassospira povalilytica TaxID=732237 RepID=UPI003AA89E62